MDCSPYGNGQKKDRLLPVWSWLCRCGFVAFRQPGAVAFLFQRQVGLYIRSHEEVQRISIRDRLNDFIQAHGTELAAALAPELMNYSGQHPVVQRCAMQH